MNTENARLRLKTWICAVIVILSNVLGNFFMKRGMPASLPTPLDYITVLFQPWVSLGVLLLIVWTLLILLLALPIPFDNLIPAWAIMFFCMALIERDGVMAMLGWVFTVLTVFWTIFLLTIGIAMVHALLSAIF